MKISQEPERARALRPVPKFERAGREVSKMFSEAGIRHALVGALGANAYRSRPRTTEDIDFLVGDEAFETQAGGWVTLRVPVVEFRRNRRGSGRLSTLERLFENADRKP
jgi:hypothetical protein